MTRHGLSKIYRAEHGLWKAMLRRCNNPNSRSFQWYGAKGIKVCERWRSFDHFMKDMGARPDGLTLDRIDITKGYSPANCRWTTWQEQGREKRVLGYSKRNR